MKRNFFSILAVSAIFSAVACNTPGTDTTTDSTTVSTASDNTTSETVAGSSGSAESSFDESASYVDLTSGKTVKLRRDTTSGFIANYETNEPVLFYYNPVTSDTFDRSGRVVNNYLVRDPQGVYRVDEERWKTKVDEDGDAKVKDGDETKIKSDGNEPETKIKTADSKEKVDENSYKSKSTEGKVKVKDDKVKVKPNNQ